MRTKKTLKRYKLSESFKFRFVLVFNIGWTIIYLIWRTFYTVPLHQGIISAVAGIALLVVEIIGMFEAFVHYYNMSNIYCPLMPEVMPEDYPEVDIFVATYNEPAEILYRTINGCVHMDYPDKRKVHIYICDDGNRQEMRELAEKMHVNYIVREDHKGAKAGNLNHAMTVTSSPYIATFDADMIPKHNFLMVTMAYFANQEKMNENLEESDRKYLGFIQTPQAFYNPDVFQYNLFSENRIPNEQDYFYKDVQISRNKSNSVIYGGSNTVIARRALEDVGGFYEKSITEDFATGILIQQKEYICYAINEVLASGIAPTDLKSTISQRTRWARGCICTGRKLHLIFTPKLKFAQRINYLASIWYWYASWKRFIYIISPILFATFGVIIVKCTLVQVLFFWLPMYISSNICLKMMSHNIRTTKWTNVYETVLFPYLMIPTLLETFGISAKKFKVTTKEVGTQKKDRIWHYAVVHAAMILLAVIGIINCIVWTFQTGRMDYFVILFWLISNLYNLIMAIFLIMGRDLHRKYERLLLRERCSVTNGIVSAEGMTLDASEGGVSVCLKEPKDFDDEEELYFTIYGNNNTKAKLKGKVVLVNKHADGWKYVLSIDDMLESKSDYIYILYDSSTTMPVNLDESTSSFDDLRLNIKNRTKSVVYQNRKMARVLMQVNFEYSNRKISIVNYNYKYVLLRYRGNPFEKISIPLSGEYSLETRKSMNMSEELYLYAVTNYKELHESLESQKAIEKWIGTYTYQKEARGRVLSLRKQRQLALDEFSELDYL